MQITRFFVALKKKDIRVSLDKSEVKKLRYRPTKITAALHTGGSTSSYSYGCTQTDNAEAILICISPHTVLLCRYSPTSLPGDTQSTPCMRVQCTATALCRAGGSSTCTQGSRFTNQIYNV